MPPPARPGSASTVLARSSAGLAASATVGSSSGPTFRLPGSSGSAVGGCGTVGSGKGTKESLWDIRPPFVRAAPAAWEEGIPQALSWQKTADISGRKTEPLPPRAVDVPRDQAADRAIPV